MENNQNWEITSVIHTHTHCYVFLLPTGTSEMPNQMLLDQWVVLRAKQRRKVSISTLNLSYLINTNFLPHRRGRFLKIRRNRFKSFRCFPFHYIAKYPLVFCFAVNYFSSSLVFHLLSCLISRRVHIRTLYIFYRHGFFFFFFCWVCVLHFCVLMPSCWEKKWVSLQIWSVWGIICWFRLLPVKTAHNEFLPCTRRNCCFRYSTLLPNIFFM